MSIETELELELELECSLCKDIYREPKTLGCLHSFCLECLETHYEKTHSNDKLRCPICRTPFKSESKEQLTDLPIDSYLLNALNIHNSLKNSVSEYYDQKLKCLDGENEATYYCLDCQEYFCEICTKSHQTMKISKNHQLIPIEKMRSQDQIKSITNLTLQIYCQIHQQEEIKLFCDDCKLAICSLCISQHSSHKIFPLSNTIIEKEKESLINLINQVGFLFFFSFLFLFLFLFSFSFSLFLFFFFSFFSFIK